MKTSVERMEGFYDERHANGDGEVKVGATRRSRPPLPPWLCNTVLSLDVHHPLRVLLPSIVTDGVQGSSSPLTVNHHNDFPPVPLLQNAEPDEPVFAFYPPRAGFEMPPPRPMTRVIGVDNAANEQDDHAFPLAAVTQEGILDVAQSPAEESWVASLLADEGLSGATDPLPFSTAGPTVLLSSISPTQSSVPVAVPPTPRSHSNVLDPAHFDASIPDEALDLLPYSKPGPLVPLRSFHPNTRIPAMLPSPTISCPHIDDSLSPVMPIETRRNNPETHTHSRSRLQHMKRDYAQAFEGEATPQLILRRPIPKSRSNSSLDFSDSPKLNHTGLHSALGRQPTLVLKPEPTPRIKPYSIPGPAHGHRPPSVSPKRVYFEAQAEDPCSSDPVEEDDYMLALDYRNGDVDVDVEALDFKWEKFDPGAEVKSVSHNVPEERHYDSDDNVFSFAFSSDSNSHMLATPPLPTADDTSHILDEAQHATVVYGDEDDELYWNEVTAWSDAHGEHSRTPPGDSDNPGGHTGEEEIIQASSSLSTPPRGPSFAPAPGIFISPLRGGQEAQQEQEQEEQQDDGPARKVDEMENETRDITTDQDAKTSEVRYSVKQQAYTGSKALPNSAEPSPKQSNGHTGQRLHAR
ncbi:hypothetical protein BKA93DRAFT_17951 [Sparassis latifolia]